MGPSIYDVHKKSGCWPLFPLSTCVHMGRIPSPCGRPHAVDMKHTALLKRLVAYNDLPDLKLKFDYNIIVIYLKLYY